MEHLAKKKETLLESFKFLPRDYRWGGSVDIVKRQVDQPEGGTKEFIDVRLRVGDSARYMALPRRGLEEVIEALQKAKSAADQCFEQRVLERSTQAAHQGRKTAR